MRNQPPLVVLATRIYAPEAAAATFRLGALVRSLAGRARVRVLTTTPPPALRPPRATSGGVLGNHPRRSVGVEGNHRRRSVGGEGNHRRRSVGVEGNHPRRSVGMEARGREASSAVPGEGVDVRRWPVLRDATGYVRGYLPYLSFDLPLALRLLAGPRPDVVVVEPPPTTGAVTRVALALRSLLRERTPYVYYAADVWSDATASTGAPAAVVRLMRSVERFALRGARDVVAVSDGVAERVRALVGPGSRVTVVPNGIDTDVFTPDGEVAAQAPGTAYLVYAGTASEWQGAEVFAEAMRRVVREVPGARLVFLGQGSSWPALRRVAAELPDGALELRPLVPPEEAAAWLRGAAAALVSVRPGLGYDFAYPTKVVAALACGTPVVFAGPGPAAEDVRRHRLGAAVEHDAGAVAEAMVRALRAGPDEHERERRVAWVHEHRSLSATGEGAADVVLRSLEVGPRSTDVRR